MRATEPGSGTRALASPAPLVHRRGCRLGIPGPESLKGKPRSLASGAVQRAVEHPPPTPHAGPAMLPGAGARGLRSGLLLGWGSAGTRAPTRSQGCADRSPGTGASAVASSSSFGVRCSLLWGQAESSSDTTRSTSWKIGAATESSGREGALARFWGCRPSAFPKTLGHLRHRPQV